MKTLLAAIAAVLGVLALALSPALANPVDDWIGGLPGSHVGHISAVDHPDVPNCTLQSHPAGCENVPLWSVSASTGYGNHCDVGVPQGEPRSCIPTPRPPRD